MKPLFLLSAVFLAACSTAPSNDPIAASSERSSPSPAAAVAIDPAKAAAPAAGESANQRLGKLIESLIGKSFYFAYDDFTVDRQYDDLVARYAAAAKAMPRGRLTLEGHADERGSKEYNLALGQKRADAVDRALRRIGAPEARLEAISFGEEKPHGTCHEERCWSENRRVDVRFDLK